MLDKRRRRRREAAFGPQKPMAYEIFRALLTTLGPTGSMTTVVNKGHNTVTAPTISDADGDRYVQDHEGIWQSVLAEETRMRGARRVENLVVDSEDLTNSWTNCNTTDSGTTVTATAANGTLLQTYTGGGTDHAFVFSVYLTRVTGSGDIDLTVDGGATWTTVTLTTSKQRFSVTDSDQTNPQFGIRIVTDTDAVTMEETQLEETTGQLDTSIPAGYVSAGVLSSPFHGANVDRVKYFTTDNGNSVSSNVVTEATGQAIDLELISNAGYTDNIGNGSKFVDTTGWTANDAEAGLSIVSGAFRVTNNDASKAEARTTITTVANKIYSFEISSGTDTSDLVVWIGSSVGTTDLVTIPAFNNNEIKRGTFKATGTTAYISITINTTLSGYYSELKAISVKAYPGLSGYFAEGAETNEITQPRDLTDETWAETGTSVAALDAVGIDGQPNSASTLTDNDGGAYEYIQESVTVTADTNEILYSVYVKKDSTTSRFSAMRCRTSSSTTVGEWLWINTSTGATATSNVVDAGFSSSGVIDAGLWWLLYATITNQSNTSADIYFYPAAGTVIGTGAVAATGSAIFDAATVSQNTSYPTSPILKTGVTTRNADGALKFDVNNFPSTEGSLELELTFDTIDVAQSQKAWVSQKNGDSGVCYISDGGGANNIRMNDGTTTLSKNSAWSVHGQTIKYKARWSASTSKMNFSLDGTKETEVAFDGDWNAATNLTLFSGTLQYGASIKNLKIYNKDLGDSWIQT